VIYDAVIRSEMFTPHIGVCAKCLLEFLAVLHTGALFDSVKKGCPPKIQLIGETPAVSTRE
jgi:hypothetical protein